MDALFLEQVWAGNESMLYSLIERRITGRPGPAARIRDQQGAVVAARSQRGRSLPGAPEKPASANFYPEGATKAEVEKWIESLRGAERANATGFFTTIRRGPDGKLIAVPYSTEYQGELAIAAQHLRAAAAATDAADAEGVSRSARRGVRRRTTTTRATSQWMELDADHRADDRAVRGLRRRVVQLQGGV